VDQIILCLDAAARETMLFAATGLLVGGLDDLILDLTYIGLRVIRRDIGTIGLDTLPPARAGGRIAVFVAAWDEEAVIGGMLATAVARFDHPDYRLYVGVYPNDPGTIAAARAVAATDPRIRVIVGPRNGPTTKADCLNSLWRALVADAAERPIKAVVLHDADVVGQGTGKAVGVGLNGIAWDRSSRMSRKTAARRSTQGHFGVAGQSDGGVPSSGAGVAAIAGRIRRVSRFPVRPRSRFADQRDLHAACKRPTSVMRRA